VIHPTALIDPSARLGSGVTVGPWAIIGPQVTVGDRCRIGPRATLQRNVRLAEDVRIGDGAILGGDPQDLKYGGEETWVEVGPGTIIREYSTINRGTSATLKTTVGARCFIMTYVHLAHDCHIGDDVVIANATQCAGHVTIHDRAILSGLNAVHQFVTIGTYAFVGGGSRVNQDIPPYVKAVGNPMELYGLNSLGLQRAGFPGDTVAALKRAYRLFFNSDLNLSQAMERARTELPALPEVERFLAFVESSERGVTARLPVGVLGVGALGQHHARHLAGLRDVRLVGVHDADRARAAKIAAELGTVAYPDMDELLGLVEAVTVAVPTPAHAVVGLRALRRGVPVLMEKPLAASLGEADDLIAEARRCKVQLQVGHIERYNRAIRAAEAYLDGPRYIESLRLAPFQPRGTDVAVVLDLMIHDLDLVLHLTGSVATEVRASGLPVLSPHLDIANARVEFANGAVALATASRVARERVRRLRLFQPNGYFSLDLATGGGEFMRVRAGWQPGTGRELADVVERIELAAPEADALLLELQSFVHAVRGERDVVVRGEEGRAALELALRVADAVRTPPLAVTAH
jgi:UDP-N-acetylglucosamine acyltransferase